MTCASTTNCSMSVRYGRPAAAVECSWMMYGPCLETHDAGYAWLLGNNLIGICGKRIESHLIPRHFALSPSAS